MARFSIFISYSQKDREILDALKRHLKPLERNADLSVWSDQDILPGDDWDSEIRSAMSKADAAILLVSADFFATDYVLDVEIPYLMDAAVEGRLILTPLFVGATGFQDRTFDEIRNPKTGEIGGVRITDFNGLNRPEQPVGGLDKTALDDALAKGTRALFEQVEKRADRGRRRRPAKATSITVELKRSGRHIDRSYSQPGRGSLRQNSSSTDLLRDLRRGDDRQRGERLFEILFGTEREWSQVLPMALGRRGTPAAHFGVRVRILTSDRELADQPWSTCRWRGHSLADQGWTFELVYHRGRPSPVRLEAPCYSLMVGSEALGFPPISAEAHWLAFRAALQRAWDEPVNTDIRWTRTVAQTLEALEAHPRLVYICANVEVDDGYVQLVLQGHPGDASPMPERLPLEDLAVALDERPPVILVMNLIGECPPVLPQLGIRVIVQLRPERCDSSTRNHALAFWNDVLYEGWDPVQAFHELPAEARRRAALLADYEVFETRRGDRTPKTDRPRSRLDRRVQREAVMGLVRDLVQSPQRKVSCVIAYGSSGNLVDHFSAQVLDTLKDWAAGIARVQLHGLSFPSDLHGKRTVADFDEHLREYLHIQETEELNHGFAALAKRGGTAPLVHFLDWGCYDAGKNALDGAALATWLSFCCTRLQAAVRGRERILSYVALVLPNDRHEDFRHFVDSQSRQPHLRESHFHLLALQPLQRITPQDLRTFLADDENTSCDPAYRHDIPERICAKTGGEFEATVQLLEDAEHGNQWPELYRTLPAAEAPPDVEDF